MAGLYVILNAGTDQRLDSVGEFLRFSDENQQSHVGQVSYVWLSHDPEDRFAPAWDPVTGVRAVVAGRLCWSAAQMSEAARLPYDGGIANRLILNRYLEQGATHVAPYNGAAMVVVWDPRDSTLHLWTDQFGYHPAFVYRGDDAGSCVITTFPDAACADPVIDLTPDEVSMAEFLRAWRATPPHTYYQEIKHVGAASHTSWNLNSGRTQKAIYWEPFEGEFFRTRDEAADALAEAVGTAVHERTDHGDRCTFFVSGGADSRVLLYAAADRSQVSGLNLYERPTSESEIARQLCQQANVPYVGIGRDGDYYPRLMPESVRWSGGMWSAEDNHYQGTHEEVRSTDATLVMTACTTDWLFKGYGLEKTYRQFMGRNLPLQRLTTNRVDGFLPNAPRQAPPHYAETIDARMRAWFKGTPSKFSEDRDWLLVEDRRIRPACYTVSVSGQIMFRVFPYDTFLADSRVAACYARLPAAWKLNGSIWGAAVSRLCRNAGMKGNIVDANFGWSLDASEATKLRAFAIGWLRRKIWPPKGSQAQSTSANDHPPSYASWPEYGWYAKNSRSLRALWDETPAEDRQRLGALWGSDPWAHSLEHWSKHGLDFFRICTLLTHWKHQRSAVPV